MTPFLIQGHINMCIFIRGITTYLFNYNNQITNNQNIYKCMPQIIKPG